MIARAHQQRGYRADLPQVFLQDHDLNAEIHGEINIQQVAGDDQGVIAPGLACQPVELLKSIMKIGSDEYFHGKMEIDLPDHRKNTCCRSTLKGINGF